MSGRAVLLTDCLFRVLHWFCAADQQTLVAIDAELRDAVATSVVLGFVTKLRAATSHVDARHAVCTITSSNAEEDVWMETVAPVLQGDPTVPVALRATEGALLRRMLSDAMGATSEVFVALDANRHSLLWISGLLLDASRSVTTSRSSCCIRAPVTQEKTLCFITCERTVHGIAVNDGKVALVEEGGRLQPNLRYAVAASHESCCQALLQLGACVDQICQDEEAWTPLDYAAATGNVEACAFLLRASASLYCHPGGRPPHCTAMYEAVVHGHVDVVRYLHGLGVSIDACSPDEWERETLLSVAVKVGQEPMVRLLCELGADVDGGRQNQRLQETPLYLAVEWLRVDVLRCLMEFDVELLAPVVRMLETYDAPPKAYFLRRFKRERPVAPLQRRVITGNRYTAVCDDRQDSLGTAFAAAMTTAKSRIQELFRERLIQ